MNTLCRNSLLVLCVVLWTGCDSGQAPAGPGGAQAGGVNPSIPMQALKPGQFTRVTCTSQLVAVTRGFWMVTHEVTQREFESVMGSNSSFFKGETLPVDRVSFVQAMAFRKALTARDRRAGRITGNMIYRLPTEAEWEHACLAGATTAFSFGDLAEETDAYLWSAENSEDKTNPVAQKKPNAWGLHDMHGNVWEWVVDWFAAHSKDPQLLDPSGPSEGKHRVFKGGGWYHEAKYARSTSRFMMEPDMGINFVGFRVVLAKAVNVN
jgi:formylglycine-generating enzyme required for sulfatase activity